MPDDDLDLSLLAEELQHLAPLVASFAEADDVDREELLANASENVAADPGPLQEWHWRSTRSRRPRSNRYR